jgi:hypothetical protein
MEWTFFVVEFCTSDGCFPHCDLSKFLFQFYFIGS